MRILSRAEKEGVKDLLVSEAYTSKVIHFFFFFFFLKNGFRGARLIFTGNKRFVIKILLTFFFKNLTLINGRHVRAAARLTRLLVAKRSLTASGVA